MAGYAVSGFIDGFFRGRDWRDAKEDRKLDRERQKRLDAMNEQVHNLRLQEFGLREQEFGMRRDAYDRDVSEYERQRQLREEEAAFHRSLTEGMPGAGGGLGVGGAAPAVDPTAYPVGTPQGQPMPAAAGPATPSRPSVPASPRLGFGVNDAAPAVQPAPVATQPVPPQAAANLPPEGLPITNVQPVQGTIPPSAPDSAPPLLTRNPDGTVTAARPPRTAEEKAVLAEAARSGALTMPKGRVVEQLGVDAKAVPTGNRIPVQPVQTVDPESSAARQWWDKNEAANTVTQNNRALARGIRRGDDGGVAAGAVTGGYGRIMDFFTKTPEAANATGAQRDERAKAAKWYNSAEAGALFDANPELQEIAAADPVNFYQQVQSGRLGPVGGAAAQAAAADAGAPPAVAAAETAAASSPAPAAGAEATKAVATQAALSFGVKPGEKLTPKQVKSAADATVDWFYQNAAPKLVEFYAARGEMDKAKAYVDLIESRAGKQALEERASGLFKIINGDIDGGFDDMLTAFKRYGYVDPTFDLDEEQTGVMKDENGGFAGIRMVFTDRESGDTMEKVFSSLDEAINYATVMTDPATMVEMMSPKPGQEAGAMNDVQKRILDDANKIMEQNESRALQGLPPITQEEALQMAAAGVAAVTGQVPSGLGTLGAGAAPAIDPRITGAGPDGLYRMQ